MDTVAIAAIAVGVSSLMTSAVWSMTAFSKYVVISERLAVLETKVAALIVRHELSCTNWHQKPAE